MKNLTSLLKMYTEISQLTWVMMVPLVLFICGGSWLVRKFEWNGFVVVLFVFIGLLVAGIGAWSYMKSYLNLQTDLKDGIPLPKYDRRDYDYYDDNYR